MASHFGADLTSLKCAWCWKYEFKINLNIEFEKGSNIFGEICSAIWGCFFAWSHDGSPLKSLMPIAHLLEALL